MPLRHRQNCKVCEGPKSTLVGSKYEDLDTHWFTIDSAVVIERNSRSTLPYLSTSTLNMELYFVLINLAL